MLGHIVGMSLKVDGVNVNYTGLLPYVCDCSHCLIFSRGLHCWLSLWADYLAHSSAYGHHALSLDIHSSSVRISAWTLLFMTLCCIRQVTNRRFDTMSLSTPQENHFVLPLRQTVPFQSDEGSLSDSSKFFKQEENSECDIASFKPPTTKHPVLTLRQAVALRNGRTALPDSPGSRPWESMTPSEQEDAIKETLKFHEYDPDSVKVITSSRADGLYSPTTSSGL